MFARPQRLWFSPFLALVLTAGCEEPRTDVPRGKPKAEQPPAAKQETFIVGQRTQEIKNADVELKKGAQQANTRITAKDPITLPGNAYVTIIGRNSMLQIQHAIDLWRAENDRYPKDYAEFMDVIIKANNIALPKLPHYQDYGYDAKEHKLIILEYPDKKNQPLQ